MIKQRSGRLINDRTEVGGIKFIDLIVLVFSFLFLYFGIFNGRFPIFFVFLYILLYAGLVHIRTQKRSGWVFEVFLYHLKTRLQKGVQVVSRVCED
jgi:hypothetical protein